MLLWFKTNPKWFNFKPNQEVFKMDLYFELMKFPVFTMEQVMLFYDNVESARSGIKRLMKKGMVEKIRRNLYTCISGETGSPVANRYQIASALSDSACISHHTAAEYYGLADQVYYDVYVTSDSKFNTFSFDGYTYTHVPAKIRDGIVDVKYSGGIKVTDKERTIVDSIKDMDKISGMEEVLSNLDMVTNLNEKRLLYYLNAYNNQFLYQKLGFLLSRNKEKSGLTDNFFLECNKKIGKSKRYLSKDYMQGKYCKEWNLIIPYEINAMKNGEVTDFGGV